MEIIIGMLGTAVSVLAGVVGYLFRYIQAKVAGVEKKLEECESDRKRLWEELASKANQ